MSRTSLGRSSAYSHVKKVILLVGQHQSNEDGVDEKLAAKLPAVLLRLNETVKRAYAAANEQSVDGGQSLATDLIT